MSLTVPETTWTIGTIGNILFFHLLSNVRQVAKGPEEIFVIPAFRDEHICIISSG
jgi:hypothetical protein